MKIFIETSALRGDTKNLLAPSALFGIKYLQQSGCDLAFDEETLSPDQQQLIKNEAIKNSRFPKENSEGIIKKDQNFLFLADENIVNIAGDWTELSRLILYPERKTAIKRNTKETNISLSLNLDGTGKSSIQTGLNFFDHMLDQIARHGLIDLELTCNGDLEVDEHHTIEDTAIVLGQAIRQAISDNKAGIQRYGFVLPMDETQAIVSIALSDRPYLRWEVDLKREYVGDFPTEMLEHFFYSLAMNARATLHVNADGKNDHHVIEAIFKGFAKALRFSVSRNERTRGILPSTKGTI